MAQVANDFLRRWRLLWCGFHRFQCTITVMNFPARCIRLLHIPRDLRHRLQWRVPARVLTLWIASTSERCLLNDPLRLNNPLVFSHFRWARRSSWCPSRCYERSLRSKERSSDRDKRWPSGNQRHFTSHDFKWFTSLSFHYHPESFHSGSENFH
jgi:hypothetical protein